MLGDAFEQPAVWDLQVALLPSRPPPNGRSGPSLCCGLSLWSAVCELTHVVWSSMTVFAFPTSYAIPSRQEHADHRVPVQIQVNATIYWVWGMKVIFLFSEAPARPGWLTNGIRNPSLSFLDSLEGQPLWYRSSDSHFEIFLYHTRSKRHSQASAGFWEIHFNHISDSDSVWCVSSRSPLKGDQSCTSVSLRHLILCESFESAT